MFFLGEKCQIFEYRYVILAVINHDQLSLSSCSQLVCLGHWWSWSCRHNKRGVIPASIPGVTVKLPSSDQTRSIKESPRPAIMWLQQPLCRMNGVLSALHTSECSLFMLCIYFDAVVITSLKWNSWLSCVDDAYNASVCSACMWLHSLPLLMTKVKFHQQVSCLMYHNILFLKRCFSVTIALVCSYFGTVEVCWTKR